MSESKLKGCGFNLYFSQHSELSADLAPAESALSAAGAGGQADDSLGKTCPATCQPADTAIRFT
jgi:hypothetical protein